METWDAIRARRNVRSYEQRPIAADALRRILEAGRRSPSSQNQQRWDFVVVTDRQRLERLAEVWRGAGHVATSAATVCLVAPIAEDERTRRSISFDLGQATISMMLAAADQGIGSGHAAVHDQELARELLGVPPDREVAFMVGFGYPSDRSLEAMTEPDRRPYEDVVHEDTW
ncbi:MAG: nitroreductase family protein [Actinobacteria bacterium]|nr:nitroreductase family protein [Actinomycetota bacterium]